MLHYITLRAIISVLNVIQPQYREEGEKKMTDFVLLGRIIERSGMPMTVIANRSGIKRETLYNRLKGIGDFTASEIVALTETFGLTKEERENIFFAHEVEFNATEVVNNV